MEINYYNQEGKRAGIIELSKKAFGAKWKPDLAQQVVNSARSNLRRPYAHTKGRGEVRGGGRKPWRQKGLGRARHGSSRSPIWRHGGVTHGPSKYRKFLEKINKKARRNALFSVLSKKASDGEIFILDDLKIQNNKTQNAQQIIKTINKIEGFEKLAGKNGKTIFLASDAKDKSLKAFKNLPFLKIGALKNLNALEALNFKYLLFLRKDVDVFNKS